VRFTVTPDWKDNQLLRLVLVWFLVFTALLWVTNALLYFSKMTLDPASVVSYYLGNEATFTQPRSYQGLLELTHFHLFAMGILVLTMTHLLLFVPMANSRKALIVSFAFATALADEASGWLVRFVSPLFAYLKVAAFLGLEAVLAFMIVAVAWAIYTVQPNDYRSSAPDDED
jgi:hypothetical protein